LSLLEKNEAAYLGAYPEFKAMRSSRSSLQVGVKRPMSTVGGIETLRSSSQLDSQPSIAPRTLQRASNILTLSKTDGSTSDAAHATYPEMFRDPRLFRNTLPKCPWSSETTKEPFISLLPNYAGGDDMGNNTLVLKCEYYSLADESSWAAVYIGPVPPKEDALKHFKTEVMLHLRIRSTLDQRTGNPSYNYLQTFKVKGQWEQGPMKWEQRTWRAGEWPFKPEFWLRITVEPDGCYSYVNGKAVGFTPHPGGVSWRPASDPNLHVVLPVAGDVGEKPSWRVREAYWGHCSVGEEARALRVKWQETVGAQPQKMREGIEDELWVTGLPQATEVRDVKEAFSSFCSVLEVVLDGKGGASLKLASSVGGGEALQRLIADTNRGVKVLGTAVNVAQATRFVKVRVQ